MPRKYDMEGRAAEAAVRRRQIVLAAVDVLGEVGARGLTMEMVAERCDMATRTIYNHFPNRDDLVGEAMTTLLDVYRDTLSVEVPRDGSAADRLAAFVEILFGIYSDQGAALVTLLANREDPAISARVGDMRDWRRRQLESILRSAKRGSLRVPLKDAVAVALSLTNHASWMSMIHDVGHSPARTLSITVDAITAAVFEPTT